MEIDTHYWKDTDGTVHLISLFEYLHFTLEEQSEKYYRYSKAEKHYIVIRTDTGYWYYRIEAPQEKLRASDLISSVCATMVTSDKSSLWEKIYRKYEEFLSATAMDSPKVELPIVSIDFNHFTELNSCDNSLPYDELDILYRQSLKDPVLEEGIAIQTNGKILFPLYNNKNIVCGYLHETTKGIVPYQYTNANVGVWRIGIPEKVNEVLVFSNPREALSFYLQYQPQNAVCMAAQNIQYATHYVISRFQKVLKAKKIICAFTTDTLLGYLDDLRFIAYSYHCNFEINDTDVIFTIKQPDDALFSKFYKKIQEYNNNITIYFKKYNKTRSVNRRLILQHSIVPKRNSTTQYIECRIPMEVDALKFFVWAFQKFFFDTQTKIIKPKNASWARAYRKNETSKPLESYTIFKLAI